VCKMTTFSELEKYGCSLHRLPIPAKDPVPDKEHEKARDEAEEEFERLMKEVRIDDEEGSSGEDSGERMESEDMDGGEAVSYFVFN
jgi:hypothetical protein